MKRIGFWAMVAVCLALIASLPLQAQQQPYPYPQQQPPVYNGPDPQQAAPYGPTVLPAGTTLSIRTNENIKTSHPGSSYSAEIAEDVMGPNGQLLIPRGSPARLTVVSTGKSTLGGNDLALALQSINVNGRNYRVVSNTTSGGAGGTGIGVNKRTGEYVGGGAVLGTLLGAIAGGGKGAAIGAIVGGAGGAGAEVLTKGKQVNVPAETVLKFHLDQPIQLTT